MEGSPVRGHEKVSRKDRLNAVIDLLSFQNELVRLVKDDLHDGEVFVALRDAPSLDLQLPVWVKAHLQRSPGLSKKLEEGDFVAISHIDVIGAIRPASTSKSNLLLIPILYDSVLQGAIGILTRIDDLQLSQESLDAVRQTSYYSAPILARLYQVDRLLRQNRELAAAFQLRTHLQANLSHELRTPLAAIRGYARMIAEGRAGEVNITQKEYLSVITENTNRLIHLITWMTHVTELSSQHLKLTSFDLRDVWTSCVNAHQNALNEKGIKLSQSIPDETFAIIGDQEKLAFVFSNLLAVALKYCNPDGAITAEFSHGREKEIAVKLSETSSGIPPETLRRLLERNYTSNTMLNAASTGVETLSLSLVHDIVGMHGGRVFVNSRAGEGSTFLFTLPAVKLDGEEILGNEQAVNSGRRRR